MQNDAKVQIAKEKQYIYEFEIYHSKATDEHGNVIKTYGIIPSSGHFIIRISKKDPITGKEIPESVIWTDKNPDKPGRPITFDSKKGKQIKNFFEQYIENPKDHPEKSGFIKLTFKITETGYDNIKKYSESDRVGKDPYIILVDDCVTTAQDAYKASGLPGDIGDHFTKDNIKHMGSGAAWSMKNRYGIEGEIMNTGMISNLVPIENIAREYNVPVENVKITSIHPQSGMLGYKILPIKKE